MRDEADIKQKLKALVLYWSSTGNTEKVSRTIYETLKGQNISSSIMKIEEAKEIELLEYNLIFFGAPSYTWLPPEPVQQFFKDKMKLHHKRGDIKLCAPRLPEKWAVVFCTYSGPHTGEREAIPACKYIGQFFEHLGFNVMEEWKIAGEFHGREEYSTRGPLGDTHGRPNAEDLLNVEKDVLRLIGSLHTDK